MAHQLVGRAEELRALDDELAKLDQGRSAALALVGEPGIGKTRLLAELAARAEVNRQLVLHGSASELERDLPFSVFVAALDEYLEGLDPHRFETMDDGVRSGLAHVFPSLARFGGTTGSAIAHERYRSHRAVRELLERLTASKPLVLVLDDLHWADPASVDLVGALLRAPPAAAVLMAVAVRPRQAPERLSAALERAAQDGSLTRVDVRALTREESGDLLDGEVEGAVAAALYDESGGNPFYLEQLARAVVPKNAVAARRSPVMGLEVPPAVAAALVAEIALLSAGARRVLEGAAVAGDPFEPELAAAAAAVLETSALAAVDELLRADVVRQTDVPRRFRFRHPLVRRAVYESTAGGWRIGAHERVVQELASRGAPAAERAHHVQRSARRGDAAAVATLREAGEAAAQRAPASAATWFGEALRLLPGTAPVETRVGLLLARARALAATGQFVDGHAALLESISLVPKDSIAMRVRLTTACAGLEHLLGRHEDAHARLTRAIEGLSLRDTPEAVALMIELAMDGFFLMEYGRMREWAEQALITSRLVGDCPLTAAAAAVLAFADAASGDTAAAERRRFEATALVTDLEDAELALRLDAAANLAGAELYIDRYVEAEAHAARAVSVARSTGQYEFIPLADSILGQVKLLRGQLGDASELLDNAVEGARLSGNVQALAGNLTNRSLTALAAGDLKLALSTAEEGAKLAQGLDQSLVCAAGVALAFALLEAGRAETAAAMLINSSGGNELPLIPGVWRPRSLELLTRCWLALGRRSEAEGAAADAEATAAVLGLRMADSMALRATAHLALDGGDPKGAADRALASAAAASDVGAPVEAGLSRLLAGRAFAQSGDHERAAAELQHAAAELHACGALRYRSAAERELRRLGHQVYRRTRPGNAKELGMSSLTERELHVVRLVVDRRTNAEIADALFLSPKTIETHLRNIFHKVDVSSRVELARIAERTAPTEKHDLTAAPGEFDLICSDDEA